MKSSRISTGSLVTAVKAGVVYASSMFAIGFALGTVRTLFLAPRVGATYAVLFEAPVILCASWMVSRRCVSHLHVTAEPAVRIWMGVTAFGVLTACELVLSSLLLGGNAAAIFADYASAAGVIGLAAQVLFAMFPYLQTVDQTEHHGTEPQCNS